MEKQFFGTDGIRGKVGEAPITPEFMLKLGWAAGRVFAKNGVGQILIGKDTRISGYMFESALEAGLASAGLDVLLLGPMPTPAIAYLTRTFNARAGIVISASHNPYYDNGIKFFSPAGKKLDDDVEMAIEHQLQLACENMEVVESDRIGKVRRIDDAAGRYIEFCKSCFSSTGNLRGLKIVLDCAHGATYHIAPNVFSELGAEVVVLGTSPNGLNINDQVGSTHPAKNNQLDLGLAFDGDGDRVVMVDGAGELVDGDELVFIVSTFRKSTNSLNGGVVGTLMSNFGLEKALSDADIPFVRAAVGDRYVLAELQERGWQVGGESSGHILCMDLTSTGDGIISALQVVAAIVETGRSLAELKSGMTKFPQEMIHGSCPREAVGYPAVDEARAQAQAEIGQRGRVLLRPSGTEPVVRVMVEGEDIVEVNRLAQSLADSVAGATG